MKALLCALPALTLTFKEEDFSPNICDSVKASLTALIEWGVRPGTERFPKSFKGCSSVGKPLECAKNTVMDSDVCCSLSFLLGLLTAASASEKEGWEGVESGDHRPLVVHRLWCLQQKSDSKEVGDAGKLPQSRPFTQKAPKKNSRLIAAWLIRQFHCFDVKSCSAVLNVRLRRTVPRLFRATDRFIDRQ